MYTLRWALKIITTDVIRLSLSSVWFMRCNAQAGDFGACDCPSSSLKKYSHFSHVFMVRESNKMLVSCFYLINKCSERVKLRFKCAIHSEMVILLFSTNSMTGALSNTTLMCIIKC